MASNRYPVIDANSSVKTITIDAGATVNTPDNSILNVSGGAGAWQNLGTFNPGNGTVIFNHIDATISGSTTFYNLTIAGEHVEDGKTLPAAGLRALEGNYMSIAGTFTNGGTMFTTLLPNTIEFGGTGQKIPASGGEAFGGYHHLKVSGAGATLATSITTLNIRGNLTLNQTLPFAGKTINLAGISDQTIGGSAAIYFNNVIVNKPTGAVFLGQDVSVDGILTLTSGLLNIVDKNLTLKNPVAGTFGENSMIVAHSTGFVNASFTQTGSYLFPVGELTDAPSYSPITVDVTAGTFTTNSMIGVSVKDGKHPNNYSIENFLRKYWNVKPSGITGAVATISSTFEPLDVRGLQTKITGAQLAGTFNAVSNPWKKFAVLTGNKLIATGATLTSGQTSAFTGLTAGELGVEVYGYGTFCVGSTPTMEAVVKGGTAPYTYEWSHSLPGTATVTVPTATAGTVDYELTVRDANGFIATDNSIPVTVLAASVGGTITPAEQQICGSSFIANLILQGSVGTVLHWQKSTDPSFATYENIPNFTTTLTAGEIGILTETTYFRAVLQSGSCKESYSAVAVIRLNSTTWNGTKWSNGDPNATTSAIFAGNYSTGANISACSIVVKDGAVVLIPAGYDVKLSGKITVEKSGKFTLASNSNLFQETNVQNLGEISVQRESSALYRLDYSMWGSPVTGTQTLQQFSPQTLSNRFYTYNSASDVFSLIEPTLNNFKTG